MTLSDLDLAGRAAGPERKRCGVFVKLDRLRAFEHAMLPQLRSLVDFDIIREVGLHQEQRRIVRMKELLLSKVGSAATVQRAVSRLCKVKYLRKTPFEGDRRVVTLVLDDHVIAVYRQYAILLAEPTAAGSDFDSHAASERVDAAQALSTQLRKIAGRNVIVRLPDRAETLPVRHAPGAG